MRGLPLAAVHAQTVPISRSTKEEAFPLVRRGFHRFRWPCGLASCRRCCLASSVTFRTWTRSCFLGRRCRK